VPSRGQRSLVAAAADAAVAAVVMVAVIVDVKGNR
jgi:hypothetical protein